MRNIVLTIVLAFAFAATPALADGQAALDNAKAGFVGLVTAVAAPVLGVVNGDPSLNIPAPEVSSRIVGLITGTLIGAFQAVTGVVDLAFSPVALLVDLPSVSPEPVVQLFGDAEPVNPGI